MMVQKVLERRDWRQIEPYWYVIAVFLVAMLALYAYHAVTGFVPDRVAISVLDFEVYWYGIIITFGIGLGAFVVSDLARKRAIEIFQQTVPAPIRRRNVRELDLPEELVAALEDNGLNDVGAVLFRWTFGPGSLGVNEEGYGLLRKKLLAQSGVRKSWLDDAPWRQWNPDHVWNGLIWCLILAVIGARLYHVFTPSPSMAEVGIDSPADYFRNPMQLINLRRGGLGIYGGIAGGALGLLLFSTRQRISALKWADLGAVGVALGQFIGRWGNFFNQELYGSPTSVPWAVWIEPDYRLAGFTEFTRFHPAFLYESLWNLFAFFVLLTLWRRSRRRLFPGDIMATYLILYGIGRILMETVRLDSRPFKLGGLEVGLPIASVVSVLVAIAMIGWVAYRHRRNNA